MTQIYFLLNSTAVTGAFGVPCITTRKVSKNDGGKTASPVPLGSFQWSWGSQGTEIFVWTPQGLGWKGTVL